MQVVEAVISWFSIFDEILWLDFCNSLMFDNAERPASLHIMHSKTPSSFWYVMYSVTNQWRAVSGLKKARRLESESIKAIHAETLRVITSFQSKWQEGVFPRGSQNNSYPHRYGSVFYQFTLKVGFYASADLQLRTELR